jgi:hypothetical protein
MKIQNYSTCFFTLKKTIRCKLKNLCTHLIKQINNHCVKQWKKIIQKLKKNWNWENQAKNEDQNIYHRNAYNLSYYV